MHQQQLHECEKVRAKFAMCGLQYDERLQRAVRRALVQARAVQSAGTRGFDFVLVPATNKCVESRPCVCRLRDGGRDAELQNVDAVTALLRALKINKRVVLSLRGFNTARVSILCGWNWLALASRSSLGARAMLCAQRVFVWHGMM